jgi:hypothetical protein
MPLTWSNGYGQAETYAVQTRLICIDCPLLQRAHGHNGGLQKFQRPEPYGETFHGRVKLASAGSRDPATCLSGLPLAKYEVAVVRTHPTGLLAGSQRCGQGRAFMDLSKWNEYTEGERRGFTLAIGAAIQNNLMPPPKYVWMHPAARLSSDELSSIKEWAITRRKPSSSTVGSRMSVRIRPQP